MALTREKKEEVIKKITDIVKDAASVVFVNFHKLSVADANEMRRGLREKGVNYVVVKKTLLKRVLESVKLEGDVPGLEGEVAIAYGSDLIEPTKNIAAFEKKFKKAVSVTGGIMEGRYLTKSEANDLAKIPSRDILYGQFVTVLNAPIQQTVQVLNGVTQSFVSVLHQISQVKL